MLTPMIFFKNEMSSFLLEVQATHATKIQDQRQFALKFRSKSKANPGRPLID